MCCDFSVWSVHLRFVKSVKQPSDVDKQIMQSQWPVLLNEELFLNVL